MIEFRVVEGGPSLLSLMYISAFKWGGGGGGHAPNDNFIEIICMVPSIIDVWDYNM